jgi:glutathione reductase (NADPH)
MGLDAGQVDLADGGIAVDDYMRSNSNQRVWAAGDCAVTGALPLTPVAHAEARALAHNLLHGAERRPMYGPVPTVVYTVPPVASVGLREDDAREQGLDLDIRSGQATSWGYAAKVREQCASYKILLERDTGRILGAHLTGPHSDEVINLFTLALRSAMTAQDMQETLLAFPTAGYYVKEMLG